MWKWTSKLVITAAVLLIALRIADWTARRTSPLPTIPEPNGYDALLTVAREVSPPAGDLADLSQDAIRQIAETNRLGVERLREALKSNTGVPLRIARGWVEKHAEDVKKLRRLAVVLGIQSRAELLNGNTNSSARCLLDVICLGQALARGGLFPDGVNALAVETIGTGSLRAQIPHLDAVFCRAAAQDLEQVEARREQPERILKTEKDWSAASFGLVSRVGGLFRHKLDVQRNAEFTRRYRETMRRTRRLMLILAGHAVELETGKRVVNPSDLVPGVLRSVPLDPDKNTPMTDVPVAVNQ